MIRLVIVDDHPSLRDALGVVLDAQPELEVVGGTASIRDTLRFVERCVPDMMLVDLSLEDGSGVELVRALRRLGIESRVLIFTAFQDEFAATDALSAGVQGYCLKEQSTADLLEAITVVAKGGNYMSPRMAARIRATTPNSGNDGLLASLSRREREIFRLLLAGDGSREVARNLFISPKTVDTHRLNIGRKLGVRTSADMLRFAVAHGLAIGPPARPQEP